MACKLPTWVAPPWTIPVQICKATSKAFHNYYKNSNMVEVSKDLDLLELFSSGF